MYAGGSNLPSFTPPLSLTHIRHQGEGRAAASFLRGVAGMEELLSNDGDDNDAIKARLVRKFAKLMKLTRLGRGKGNKGRVS